MVSRRAQGEHLDHREARPTTGLDKLDQRTGWFRDARRASTSTTGRLGPRPVSTSSTTERGGFETLAEQAPQPPRAPPRPPRRPWKTPPVSWNSRRNAWPIAVVADALVVLVFAAVGPLEPPRVGGDSPVCGTPPGRSSSVRRSRWRSAPSPAPTRCSLRAGVRVWLWTVVIGMVVRASLGEGIGPVVHHRRDCSCWAPCSSAGASRSGGSAGAPGSGCPGAEPTRLTRRGSCASGPGRSRARAPRSPPGSGSRRRSSRRWPGRGSSAS